DIVVLVAIVASADVVGGARVSGVAGVGGCLDAATRGAWRAGADRARPALRARRPARPRRPAATFVGRAGPLRRAGAVGRGDRGGRLAPPDAAPLARDRATPRRRRSVRDRAAGVRRARPPCPRRQES